jgi:pimeloyl-ACP methyl ester carboxylesterase
MLFSYRDEIKELNELARKEASGSFIRLSGGFTHYELSNLEAEETVVLTHGFSVPYFIYDPTVAFLTPAGFRVLRYDLFGRGLSDRPDTRYNIDLFVRQLGDLLDALSIVRPVSLVGLSMGGLITAAFTVRFPERVSKLVLIDPVGARPFALGKVLKAAAAPGLGERLIGWIVSVRMARRITASPFDREGIGEFGPRYMPQMEYKGFKRALLSSIRNDMLGSSLEVYERVGGLHKPVLLFWGRNDAALPFKHSEVLRRAMLQAELHAIDKGGHIPHYTNSEEVNPILLSFLRR